MKLFFFFGLRTSPCQPTDKYTQYEHFSKKIAQYCTPNNQNNIQASECEKQIKYESGIGKIRAWFLALFQAAAIAAQEENKTGTEYQCSCKLKNQFVIDLHFMPFFIGEELDTFIPLFVQMQNKGPAFTLGAGPFF